jgi:hypothetical protein
MHKVALLASVMCALLVIGIVIWMVVGPVLRSTYSVTMQHPKTHEIVVCQASFEPANRAFEAVEAC